MQSVSPVLEWALEWALEWVLEWVLEWALEWRVEVKVEEQRTMGSACRSCEDFLSDAIDLAREGEQLDIGRDGLTKREIGIAGRDRRSGSDG